jgi:DNA gyrase subunit B
MARSSYSEANIVRLKFPDNVRENPGMYLGERGRSMVFQCVKEIFDNSADEFMAGRNKSIFVYADNKANVYLVADKAQGIPVGLKVVDPENPRSKKASTLTLIFTELHTGGKFNDSAYKKSRGVHGVGAAGVNAVSSSFEVWTFRDKAWHYQKFSKGKPVTELLKEKPPVRVTKIMPYKPVSGTIVLWSTDQTIVSTDKGKTKATLDLGYTAAWMKSFANLNPGLEVTFSANGKSKTFLNKGGLESIIKQRLAERDVTATGRMFSFIHDDMSVALQWSTYSDDDALETYVCSGRTRDDGEHELGFRNSLNAALAPFKKKTQKFAPKDAYSGLVGILDWKMHHAEYSGQTKDRLTSNVSKQVEALLLPQLKLFFDKNKPLARAIVKRAMAVKVSKEAFKKTLSAIADAKGRAKSSLPSSLVAAPKCPVAARELYLVEGDSAAGCFIGNTPVLLSDGSTILFEEMAKRTEAGEQFKGFAFNLKTKKEVEVIFDEPRLTKWVDELIEVELSDGTTWICTIDHPWLQIDGIYTEAQDLKEGIELQTR